MVGIPIPFLPLRIWDRGKNQNLQTILLIASIIAHIQKQTCALKMDTRTILKSDLINYMDNISIPGIEPSSVILSQIKYSKILK